MPKAIILTQTMFSKVILDDRKTKAIFFILVGLVFALVAVYLLQTGDLIQKTFSKIAYETKVEKAASSQAASEVASKTSFSFDTVEEMIAGNGFVPVEQVQYIPLTATFVSANQLVSNAR